MGLRSKTSADPNTSSQFESEVGTTNGYYSENSLNLGLVSSDDYYDKDLNNYNFTKIEEFVGPLFGKSPVNNNVNKLIIDLIYPKGSVYIAKKLENQATVPQPPTASGVVWERITDKFLYAAVDGDNTYGPGITGGEKEATLNENNLPEHTHKVGVGGTNTYGNYDIRVPAYKRYGASTPWLGIGGRTTGTFNGHDFLLTLGDNVSKESSVFSSKYLVELANTGNNTTTNDPINIMPPFEAVYMWVRTA